MTRKVRIAESIDDLKVGQWVAWFENGEWQVSDVWAEADGSLIWDFTGTEVILSDPPAPKYIPVASEKIKKLAMAIDAVDKADLEDDYMNALDKVMQRSREIANEVEDFS